MSHQPELCLLITEDGLPALASLSKNIRGSLRDTEESLCFRRLSRCCCLVFSPPSWRMTGNFDLDQAVKIA